MTGRGRLAKGAAPPSILWFRQDLRLADQPALRAAAATGGPVIPVYIWSPQEEGEWPPGAAARWWIARSLRSLETELQARGSLLVIRRGPAAAALRALARETGAERIVYTRRIEPAAREQEEAVRQAFPADGRPEAVGCPGSLLFEPEEVRTRAGGPFQVFTPFYRACLALTDRPEPFSAPRRILYDNLKSVVIERVGEHIRFHPQILECAGHYHFAPTPCAPSTFPPRAGSSGCTPEERSRARRR